MLLDVILLDPVALVQVAARTNVQPLLLKEVTEFGICVNVWLELFFKKHVILCGGDGFGLHFPDVGKELGVPALLGWYPGN